MTGDELLHQFHARHPGATARGLARGRCGDGRSSYEVLAAEAAAGASVLDLGCGDGHLLEVLMRGGHAARDLVGVDLSAAELALAARRGFPVVQARAQALPLSAGSIDVALSHLGFTLMSPIESVCDELARVLRPGGRFAAIVGGGPKVGDAFERFVDLLAAALRRARTTPPRLGDPRARSDAGLASLLSPARGFADLRVEDLALDLGGPVDEVWRSLAATSYELLELSPAELEELRAGFAADVRGDAPGRVACRMAIRLVVAVKR